MLIRPSNAAIALVVVLVGVLLATMVPHAPLRDLGYAEAADTTVTYAENGTGPVATFTATDEDGDPIEWSLSGTDAEAFSIDGGVLAFKKSPNFEMPADTDGDNVYEITLNASDGSHDVAVTVTNEDEAGSVTLSDLQPQVGASVTATLDDPDGDTTRTRWQWSRSADLAEWTDIDGARSSGYTPAEEDEGMYLRAVATYYDSVGDDAETAEGMSDFAVEVTPAINAPPEFPDQEPGNPGVQKSVALLTVKDGAGEGASIGDPVAATDANNDPLLYTMGDADNNLTNDAFEVKTVTFGATDPATSAASASGDSGYFEIDPTTGQISVKNEDAVDFESSVGGAAAGTPLQKEFVVTVTAKDPSGSEAMIDVIIVVAPQDEAPEFTEASPSEISVDENTQIGDADPPVGVTYEASDTDADIPGKDGTTATNTIEYSLEGDDADRFYIGTTSGVLVFKTADNPNTDATETDEPFLPDFEDPKDKNKDNKYEVTVVAKTVAAADVAANRAESPVLGRKAVTVTVENGQDAGIIILSQLQPYQGATVTAVLNDKDGGTAGTAWQWYRGGTLTDHDSDATTPMIVDLPATIEACATDTPDPVVQLDTPCSIPEATSSTYTPGEADNLNYLTVRASYFDSVTTSGTKVTARANTDATVKVRPVSNAAPKFVDQDSETVGVQNEEASRSVDENKANENVGDPVDAADSDPANPLLYTLGGPDAASFKLESRKGGQIKTAVELDYETKNSYTVTLTATDPLGASATITVNISVNDKDDPAVISDSTGTTVTYAENGTGPVATFTA
ncbi:MAG: cadherin domain-containing protein, partial [Dehalococcoidia bacterium]|nr:cadherin domain-containing protein [Dehalococcoidia bacterium]